MCRRDIAATSSVSHHGLVFVLTSCVVVISQLPREAEAAAYHITDSCSFGLQLNWLIVRNGFFLQFFSPLIFCQVSRGRLSWLDTPSVFERASNYRILSYLTLHYIKSDVECPKSLGPLEHYNIMAVWLSGNALASINVVALRQTRLVLGWVTVCGRVNHFGM